MLSALSVLSALVWLLLTICAVRVLYLRQDYSLLTGGLCAVAVAFVLYLPGVNRVVDRQLADAPLHLVNVAHLGHILLTLAAWCALGRSALKVFKREQDIPDWLRGVLDRTRRSASAFTNTVMWWWNISNAVTAAVVLVLWFSSDLSRIPVDDMLDLHDPSSRAVAVLYSAWAFVGGILVVTGSLIGLRSVRAPRPALWVTLGIGCCGIGYAATALGLAAMGGTPLLQAHRETVMEIWAIPGMILLSIGGTAAIVAKARGTATSRVAD
ncbi:hypothetical protein ACIP5Y_32500 [Nocardia sp. NPDC088792]|uniref:hypothetical protein n=1 Tax=Nocardia sp. NPDC088792 TaxID=3364332 RepID=UPI0037FB182F